MHKSEVERIIRQLDILAPQAHGGSWRDVVENQVQALPRGKLAEYIADNDQWILNWLRNLWEQTCSVFPYAKV